MSLEEKLIVLDERITARFQKIVDWGYKRFGADKYDWAGRASDASGITLFGEGVYLAIDGVTNHNPNMLFGAGAAFLGLQLFYGARERVKSQRKFEEEFLEDNGAPLPPRYNALRPVMCTIFPSVIAGVASSVSAPVSYAFYCGIAAVLFTEAASYFRSTTMYPPKKKKTLADAWDWAKEKLAIRKPAMQEASVHYCAPVEVER